MKNTKAIIFDLDGTLLDTLGDLTDGVNHTMRVFGYPTYPADTVRSFVGNGIGNLIERCVPGGRKNPDYDAALAEFRTFYSDNCMIKTVPYTGIVELLKSLKERGIGTAIVSNKNDLAVKRLSEKYFGGLIAAAVGERDGIRRKPAPDSVLAAAEDLGANTDECLYVGDSEVDIAAAKNAEMRCISVDWGFKTHEFLTRHGAETIIGSPDELLDIITYAKMSPASKAAGAIHDFSGSYNLPLKP